MGARKLAILGLLCLVVLITEFVLRRVMPQLFEPGLYTAWYLSMTAAILCGVTFYPALKFCLNNPLKFSWKRSNALIPAPEIIGFVLIVYIAGSMAALSSSVSIMQIANIPSMTLESTQDMTETAVYAWQHSEKAEVRKAAAFVIASEYAVAVPYLQDDGQYVIGTLTDKQIESHKERMRTALEAGALVQNSAESMAATAKMLGYFYTIFAVLMLTTMVLDSKRGQSVRHHYHRYYWYATTLAFLALYLLSEYGHIVQIHWLSIVILCLTLPGMLLYNIIVHVSSQGRDRANLALCSAVMMMQMIGLFAQFNLANDRADNSVFQPYYNETIRSALNSLVNGSSGNARKQSANALYHHMGLAVDYRNEAGDWVTFTPKAKDVETYHDMIRQQRAKLVHFERAYSEQKILLRAGVAYGLGLIVILLLLLPLARRRYQGASKGH